MRALLQRVTSASVTVAGERIARIEGGLLALVCAMVGDDARDATALARKTAALRIFADAQGRMDRDVREAGGACLVVSQFTLAADTTTGRRPAFTAAASPDLAKKLLALYCTTLGELGLKVHSGRFGASMQVELCNDGPVTIWLDSRA